MGSLLGLGDIVIPGIFLALLLRFDAERANIVPNNGINVKFPKPYFLTTFIAYFFGLATTIAVMYYFKAAQPALLYLVPACLLSSFGVALIKGEVKTLFNYTESDDFSSVESEEKKEK